MRFTTGPYRDLQDKSQLEQVAETTINWLAVSMCLISIALFLISCQYAFSVSQALAAESVWHKLESETPSPKRNLWVYWTEGECARLVKFDEQLGFYTSQEQIAADWWLYSFGDDPPPVEFCRYE